LRAVLSAGVPLGVRHPGRLLAMCGGTLLLARVDPLPHCGDSLKYARFLCPLTGRHDVALLYQPFHRDLAYQPRRAA
ncbi:hypothetical protein, partial [Salmonella enterica]|uniref:hypothetical protein n=1 Tax=Salmonella enterica TaxID=28901 RepID=UPI00398C6887